MRENELEEATKQMGSDLKIDDSANMATLDEAHNTFGVICQHQKPL